MLAPKSVSSSNSNVMESSDPSGLAANNNNDQTLSMTIYFNCCKKESMTPNHGFKTLVKRLRNTTFFVENAAVALDIGNSIGGSAKLVYKVGLIKDEKITLDRLREARMVVFGCSQEPFSASEVLKSNFMI